MNHMDQNVKELFQEKTPVPHRMEEAFLRAYAQIADDPSGTVQGEKGMRRPVIRLALAVGVAAALLVSAGAIALYSGFWQTAFGDGVPSTEHRVYEFEDGNTVETFAHQRVEVSEEQAQERVGEYLQTADVTVEVQGRTVTVENYIMDEQGIAAVTYSVENPKGLEELQVLEDGSTFVEVEQAGYYLPNFYYETEETYYNAPVVCTYYDQERSTETKAYLVAYILPRDPVSHPTALIMLTFYEDEHAADGSGWSSLEQELPVEKWVPILAYQDQTWGVEMHFSSLGFVIDLPEETSQGRWSAQQICLVHENGDKEQILDNLRYGGSGEESVLDMESGWLDNTTASGCFGSRCYCGFNRLITADPAEIQVTLLKGEGDKMVGAREYVFTRSES